MPSTRTATCWMSGCANGYLLECLVQWGHDHGLKLTPYGLDQGTRLVQLARQRQPQIADHFFVGNAWDWSPARRFRYVYTLLDQVPSDYLKPYLHRLLTHFVTPGGRLIVGDYGSRSRRLPPRDVAAMVEANGLAVAGESAGGEGGITRFAWVDRDV